MRRNSSVNLGRRSTICGFFCCSTCYSNHTCGELNPAEYLLIERNLQGARAASFVALRATLTIRVASLILLTVCRLDEIFQGVCGGCLFSGICDWRVPTLDRGKDQRKHHGDEEEAFRRTKLDDHRPKIYKRPPVS